jgi:bifunctional UDP-N-acetylglucosamine pyrophosphorylase/glucosamine-1-phosphate N-acetyltransferase
LKKIIIPAAGSGSRLNLDLPKLLVKINNIPIIQHILSSVPSDVDEIVVIVSPSTLSKFEFQLRSLCSKIKLAVQESPLGMGDAIFGSFDLWSDASEVVVIWGDQVLVQKYTLIDTFDKIKNEYNYCVPLVEVDLPYVQFVIHNNSLKQVLQQREGDELSLRGYSDVGVFGFNTHNVLHYWQDYLKIQKTGNITKEVNFLPFLPYLSNSNWRFNSFFAKNLWESLGINTKEDIVRASLIIKENNRRLD